MSYIENNLMEGESLIYRAHLHWIIFVWPVFFFIIAVICFSGGKDAAPVGVIFIMIAMIAGLVSLIKHKTSEFGVTNKRVIVKVGFISRNSLEVLLNKVEGIQVDQGIIGRILGYGSITVS